MKKNKLDFRFNSEMNLLKMIGIVHVVISHVYAQLFSVLRQSYSFHMPLFYFISGYFYNQNHEKEKKKYIWSKFKKNVGLFYFYFFIMIIFSLIINWKYSISLGTISWYTIFVKPFTLGLGNPGFLMGPAWFILSLFLVQSVFIFLFPLIRKIFKKDLWQVLFFLTLGITSLYFCGKSWMRNEFLIMFSRTMIGMMFYYFGYFYSKNIEGKINIFNGKILGLSLIIISILVAMGINLKFDFASVGFDGRVFVPIITSILGIYISVFIAKGLNKIIKNENDILHVIGRNSLYIMIFQFLVFFIISLMFFKSYGVLDDFYSSLTIYPFCPSFININKFWPLYTVLGLLLPSLYGELVSKFKKNK
ncbi:hypothetical protein SDC9_95669 [bioreactor metagenome]|uniref:Acyltransferase 3 domain-containing protein n=1 Tax=bioreactor metagenome TaxID=1076179 RepID=A0A645A756_9ZZZZ